jgi:hypothetical protein
MGEGNLSHAFYFLAFFRVDPGILQHGRFSYKGVGIGHSIKG